MDNLTHTLIGGAYFSVLPKRNRARSAFLAATIGSNLPDIDVVQRFLPGQTAFDYLIHHRGYTHTLLLAVPFALALSWILRKFCDQKNSFRALTLISLGAVLLHLFADSWNDYGVHPFTPFFDRWFYGDSIFIVEPFLWMLFIPLIHAHITLRGWIWTYRAISVLLLAVIWMHPAVTPVPAIALTLVGTAAWFYFSRPRSTIPVIAGVGLVIAAFFIQSTRARAVVAHDLAHIGEVRDVHSSPAPGNPFCWRAIAHVKDAENHRFFFTKVTLTPLGSLLGCRLETAVPRTAEVQGYAPTDTDPQIEWLGTHVYKIAEFDSLKERSCDFRRILSFARFPFWKTQPDGTLIAGDLRYDREPGRGFAEFEFGIREDCEGKLPFWEAPFDRR